MNFTIKNNVPWRYAFTIPGTTGLLNAGLRMQLKTVATSDVVALDISTDNGRLSITDKDARTAEWHVDRVTMEQIDAGAYLYDCIVTPTSGDEFEAISGTVSVVQGVTLAA